MTTGPAQLAEIPGNRAEILIHAIAFAGQSASLALRHTKIKLSPVSRGSSHHPSTGLARLV